MKYMNKEISEMTDAELLQTSSALLAMETERNKATSDLRFTSRFPDGALPPVNPLFQQLKDEVEKYINQRQLKANTNA